MTDFDYKSKFAELRQEFGNSCFICGSTNDLQFAHVYETQLRGSGRGQRERYHDIVKNKNKYKLTCSKHNSMVDKRFKRILYKYESSI